MDKKAKKRDIAVFANMLKELMQTSEGDTLQTLDRDIQHFIYGRIALMVKHNEGKPIGSIGDIGAVVGASLADVTKEFVRGRNVETDKLDELFTRAGENMLMGYNSRRPQFEVNVQAPVEEKQPEESEQ